MGKMIFRSVLCGRLFYPLALTCFIFVAFQFYLFLAIGNMRNDYMLVNKSSDGSEDMVFRRRQFSNSKQAALKAREDPPEVCQQHSKETLSALKRAKTSQCKELIIRTSCLHQHRQLFPTLLKRTCPNSGSTMGRALGCYRDSSKRRLLADHMTELKDTNSPGQCVNYCLRLGFSYAGVEYSKECHCALNIPANISNLSLPQHLCDSKCPANSSQTCGGYYALDVFQTGFTKFYNNATYVTTSDLQERNVKVMFMLTFTGRGLRQVLRLLKTIYRPHHYYLIHVDQRQEYLHRELKKVTRSFDNIQMTSRRFSTIWGGASLLEMLLSCMREAMDVPGWTWDYFVNLSESDYPIKTMEELEFFLTKNSGKNFLKSHGKNTARFIQRQGLDMLFLECENRMWRLGTRSIQSGINIDGGSDWIGLHRSFVTYIVSGSDQLLNGLKAYWKYSLLPAESFFHTVLQNSRFCWSLVNNNLHLTNWRRKQGCHCQYKHVVDWCGCSPNDYRLSDFTKLQNTKFSPEYFARKFEAIINQDIINLVDEHLLKRRTLGQPSADSFWLNIWNSEDDEPNDLLLTFFSSLTRTIHSRCSFRAPLKILDAHVFKRLEKLEGVVVTVRMLESDDYRSNNNNNNTGRSQSAGVIEALFSPTNQNYDFLRKRKPFERINHVEVGTDFDPKEEIFRNYLSVFGPHADIVASFHVVPDPEAESTLAMQLVDPLANVVYTSSFTASKGASIVTHAPRLEKPLRPGTWMVKTREVGADKDPNINWTIQSKFLVLPLSHHRGRLINEKEASLFNQGPFTSPNEAEEPKQPDPVARNSPPLGRDLDEWIDQLLASFWNQASSCLAVPLPEAGQSSLCRVLPPCSETYWSTLYPDPKSSFVPPSDGETPR